MSENQDALSILRLWGTPGIGPARLRQILDWLDENRIRFADFLENRRLQEHVLKPEQVNALQSNIPFTIETWKRLAAEGTDLVTLMDPDYPRLLKARLGPKAPPVLFVKGNRAVLNAVSVGFCGSRKASAKGLRVARDTASEVAKQGTNVISGYAAGVDLTVHEAALEAGSTTTLVLAEGVLRFKVKRALQKVWDWDRVAIVSEFLPDLPWTVHNAMHRNQVICGMSHAMVLIEAKSSGGSMAAGNTCLELGVPLFAAVYEGMPRSAEGNEELLKRGARKLQKSRRTGKANVRRLTNVVREQEAHGYPPLSDAPVSDQLGVFD